MDKQALLNKYISNLGESKYRSLYVSYAKRFLESTDATDKETVSKFLADLRKEGKSPGTVHFVFGVIRRLFKVNELNKSATGVDRLEWPYRRGEAPQVRQRDVYKPGLDTEVMAMMIEVAKEGKIDADPACFLALSTTYGLRRQEMCDLQPGDVDLGGGTIFISTVKFGRERYHLIPEEIIPYLAKHDFKKRYSPLQMSSMFWVVVNSAGLKQLKSKKLGWHSIRRSLLHLLYDAGLNPQAIHQFMRWRGASPEFAMDTRYYATTFVGLETTRPAAAEAEPDREIFSKHPLLCFWRGKDVEKNT